MDCHVVPPRNDADRPIIRIDPRYFQEMVAADLADAKKHALLKQHGYNVNVSVE